jgi:hypothetical protein
VPSETDRQHKEEACSTPRDNWSIGFVLGLFEISATAVASLVLLDFSIRAALATKYPSTR